MARFAGFYYSIVNKIRLNIHIGTQDMDLQDAFHTEIQFWDDMLSAQTEQAPPEMIERMKMAKLLAEQKLSLYSVDCAERMN